MFVTMLGINYGNITHGVISAKFGLGLIPLAAPSCLLSAGGEVAPRSELCDRSSGESHNESIMCNKLLRKSSYSNPNLFNFQI